MDGRDIDVIMAEHGGLRTSIKKLELSVKNCDKKTISHMLDSKTELELLSKTKTIQFNDWKVINKKLRDLGNKFTDYCVCGTK